MSKANPATAQQEPAPEVPYDLPIYVIARIGRAVYGDLWIGKLAADVGWSHQSIRRWLADQGSPTAQDVHRVKAFARFHASLVMRAVGDDTP